MLPTTSSSLAFRLKGDLPPTPPLPALVQTLACRWLPLGFFEWCRAHYGHRFTLYPVDLPPVVLLSSPADIRQMLTAPASVLHPGDGGRALTPIVGQASFMLREEDEHMSGRRAILPAFSRAAAETHAEIIAEITSQEIARWPSNTPIAVYPRLRRLTLRVILRAVFGQENADLWLLQEQMLDMLNVTASFVLVEPRLRHLPGWHSTWKRFVQARTDVDTTIARLIQRGKQTAEDRSDVLATLLAARNPDGSQMSDRQLRDNIVSVILAGHETTASELAWAFQLIAHHPQVRKRLIEEIASGLEDAYLMATIAEVLRHRPVFLFSIPRAVVEPIEIGGWTYRPPAQLLGCIYLLQHDSAHYREPAAFQPERFLEHSPHSGTWLPWGGGRKRCPGHRLATLEMRTVLRAVLAQRDIHPADRHLERAKWRSVIVTPSRGSRVVLRTHQSMASSRSVRS